MRALILAAALVLAAPAAMAQVVINGKSLSRDETIQLQQVIGPIQPGRYWYDPASGVYGMEGGPMAGAVMAGLPLPRLPASASGGGSGRITGVFLNGREIHPAELQFYRSLFGQVPQGRYWMNAQGIGGVEGGPASFNLPAAIQQQQAQRANRSYGGYRGGAVDTGGTVYMPGIGSEPGISVGQASDGCTYVSYGDYSNDYCP